MSGVGGRIELKRGCVEGCIDLWGFEGDTIGIAHAVIDLDAIDFGCGHEDFEVNAGVGEGGMLRREPKINP